MTKKDEFIHGFKAATGEEAESYYKNKNYKDFVALLHEHGLTTLFRESVEEATPESDPDEQAAAGMSALFGNE